MWVIWTLVFFAVLGWLGYAWLAALLSKYQHTRESSLVFLVLAALALLFGSRIANQIAPAWSFGPRAAVAVGVGFTAFVLFSFLAVNIWCSLLTRRFDEKIASFEEEEDVTLRRLDAMRWKAIREAEYPSRPETEAGRPKAESDETVELRKIVESWEQGGGAARIRSLKVLEWREEIAGRTAASLDDEIRKLEEEMPTETDEGRREQSKAKVALLKLTIRERAEPPPRPETDRSERIRPRMPEDELTLRERLQSIHAGIQCERAARAEFVRQRVRLSWRARK
jgi:hypothetical protein